MTTWLYRTDELRAAEQRAAASLPAGELMRRAGECAARWLLHVAPDAGSFAIACGPGNNGGDGYACATTLLAAGKAVVCIELAPPAAEDARAARKRWTDAGGVTRTDLPPPAAGVVAVDAMFGIGGKRGLAGKYLDAVRWLDAHDAVYALDVPSGLDADTGAWIDGVEGVHARSTITFIGAKPGLFTAAGSDAAGAVVVEQLGVDCAPSAGALIEPALFRSVVRPRRRNSHKGSFGNLVVMGGAAGMVGAALLAARAALRLGAGRVYADCFGAPDLRFDPQQPELMFRSLAAVPDVDVIVAGCGMGTAETARAQLLAAFGRSVPLVLDADALNLIAAEPSLGAALSALVVPRVLTPHPLEAARLLQCSAHDVQADRIGAARRLADRNGSVVVLKGAGSIVAEPHGRYWINTTGGPALATAGTGDVLAGIIGALMAQGHDVVEAGLAAVWLHGAGGDSFDGDTGLVASELPVLAVRALARLRSSARGAQAA